MISVEQVPCRGFWKLKGLCKASLIFCSGLCGVPIAIEAGNYLSALFVNTEAFHIANLSRSTHEILVHAPCRFEEPPFFIERHAGRGQSCNPRETAKHCVLLRLVQVWARDVRTLGFIRSDLLIGASLDVLQ